jgi:phosphoesterase RecJ-like protein
MIYRLFEFTQTRLDKKDALNVYTAILTDTGSFRHSNTTSATLRIASELLKFGIEPAKTYSRVYENNSVGNILLVAKIISKISFGASNKIAWVKVRIPEFKKIQAGGEILDKILDFAKSVNTVKVVIILSQVKKGLVKLNFRSKSPIDVQRIAKLYGGGGHKFASGCTIEGSLKEAEHKVLRQVKKALL